MPPPADPREIRRTDGNGYPRPDINDTRSPVSQLTSEPLVDEVQFPAAAHSTPEPDNTLVYPDPTPDPDVKPKIESIDPAGSLRPGPSTTIDPQSLQTPEASVPLEGRTHPRSWRGGRPWGIRGWGRGRGTGELNPRKRRRPTEAQLEKSDSGPDPDDKACRPTCVADASKLNLDIHLATVLSNKGLAILCTEGLIRVQMLCRMIAVMTMSPTKISEESAEALVDEYNRDAQLLFVGADPQKVRLLSVEEQEAIGWQLTFDVPATLVMRTVDEMPDTSYDYDDKLYSNGES
ncbi:hypothetical protein Moror_15001 [Moniliophthora roreri MCA 2997]|uniref:Reverse transcriptase-rnase h-integrase n=1 Tax=Moniliophthora roreri (strain MCA 2997) TaxID=1381753 RepID=V2XUU6_MONRO|nr:hypothetical protein Moror_15001 [Moniliophthora roreri MCA 2997]